MTKRRTTSIAVLGLICLIGLPAGTAQSAQAAAKKKKTRRTTTTIDATPVAPAVASTIAPATTLVAVAATAKSSVNWSDCGKFECATVQVPIDYAVPTSPTIGIALNRVKPTNPAIQKSILINPGGPSGSGLSFLESLPALFTAEARAQFNVIGFDPRGVGKSSALPCGSTRDRSARTGQQYIAAIKDACTNRAPDLIRSITTANTARDLETIRVALGEEKLNYYGVSYGTYLGLVYADLFPNRVGRFIFDSAVDPRLRAIELTAGQYATYESTVVDFFRRCDASQACPFRPDSLNRYDKLLAQVTQRPIFSDKYAVGRGALESITLNLIRRGQEPLLARVLTEFEAKNGSSINELIVLFDNALPDVNDLTNDPDGDGMYFQVACAEGFHPSSSLDSPLAKLQLIAKGAPRFSVSASGAATSQVCPFWGQQVDTRPIPQAKPGVPGMLFVGSRGDSVTPIGWTRRVASEWPGSVMLDIPGPVHGAIPSSPCLSAAAGAFLVSGQLPATATCAA